MKKNLAERPFFRFMGRLGDTIALNFLWLLGCLPVVTAGASTLALFSVLNKMAADEEYFVWKGFSGTFRREFKTATKLWLPLLLFFLIVLWDIRIGTSTEGAMGGVITAAAVVLGLLCICVGLWGFALLARFQYDRVSSVLKDAAALAAANLQNTIVIFVLALWIPALLVANVEAFSYLLPAIFLIGPGGSMRLVANAMRPAFRRIEARAEAGSSEPEWDEAETLPELER